MNETDKQALLNQLQGAHLPDFNVWAAPAWWLLLALLIVLATLVYSLLRRRRDRLWQRQALTELQRIRSQVGEQPVSCTLADCSQLARRVLLLVRGRKTVASLQGRPWLEALDAICGQSLFANGFGGLLESAPYQRAPAVAQGDLESLLDAMDELIRAAGRQKRSKGD